MEEIKTLKEEQKGINRKKPIIKGGKEIMDNKLG